MENYETRVVDTYEIETANIKESLRSICDDLDERGYNSIKQIVAYLVSGEVGYISSYKECRSRLSKFKREDILEIMLGEFINK